MKMGYEGRERERDHYSRDPVPIRRVPVHIPVGHYPVSVSVAVSVRVDDGGLLRLLPGLALHVGRDEEPDEKEKIRAQQTAPEDGGVLRPRTVFRLWEEGEAVVES